MGHPAPTTLLNVAASVRSAASLAGSPTFECSIIDEVRGDAYGFGGLTQERRCIAGKLEVAAQSAAA